MKLKKKVYGILAAVLLLVTSVFIGTQGGSCKGRDLEGIHKRN